MVRLDRAALKRHLGPLLLMTVLVVLTMGDMPVARMGTRLHIPMLPVRLVIAVIAAIYYLRVIFSAVEIVANLIKRELYRRDGTRGERDE